MRLELSYRLVTKPGLILALLFQLIFDSLPVAQAAVSGFHISGRFLLDSNENNFIMRGINHPHNWYPDETSSFAKIKAQGANTVRVVLSLGHWWPKNTASDVANVIDLCKVNKLICVLEVHDTTGYGETDASTLAQAVAYWTEMKSVLDGQEAYVIINLGNEPYGNLNTAAWVNDTKNAIVAMRNAGFQHVLMIDGPDWGQDWEFVMRDNAAEVLASDPTGNTIFSIHMYGVFDTASAIQSYVSTFVNAELPLVIGEFGDMHTDGDPDEDTILAVAEANGIGYLGWSWSGNTGGLLDMVVNFDPAQMTAWGTRIIYGENGIRKTSCEASVYGSGPNPKICAITRKNPSPTDVDSVGFSVKLSEGVTGVGLGDFILTAPGLNGTSIGSVTGSGDTYTVMVNTGSGIGTIRLDVVDDDSIKDTANNPLGGIGAGNGSFVSGETYQVMKYFRAISRWTTAFDLSHGWTVAQFVRTVGDVNGDGQDDLVGFGQDGVYIALALNPGPGFEPISRWTQSFDLAHLWTVQDYVRTVGDVNGDGQDDLVGFGKDGVYVALSTGNGFDPISRWTQSFDLAHLWTVQDYVRTVGDVNGDGKDDLVGFGKDGVYIAPSTGNGFDPISRWTQAFDLAHLWTVQDYVRTVGDVNGDGKDDLVGFGKDGVYIALSTGNGFDPISRWTQSFDLSHGWTVSQFVRTVGDVNGDGKDDLVGFGQDGVYVATSTRTTFDPISRWTTSFDLSHGWTVAQYARTVGDVNGDGKADLVGFGTDGVYIATAQ